MEKKMRNAYVDGAYVTQQEEPVIVKVSAKRPPKTVDSKDKK